MVGIHPASGYSLRQQRSGRSHSLSLFDELRRRNVFRLGIDQVLMTWLLLTNRHMKAISYLIATLFLAASSPAHASDTDELTAMLHDFLAGASQNDAAAHDRFWAEELVYTSSAGERRGKAEIMHGLSKPPRPGTGRTGNRLHGRRHSYPAVRGYGNCGVQAAGYRAG